MHAPLPDPKPGLPRETNGALPGPLVPVRVSVFRGIALLCTMKRRDQGFFGNLTVTVCVAMTFLVGAAFTSLHS